MNSTLTSPARCFQMTRIAHTRPHNAMSSQLTKNAVESGTNSRLRSNTIRIPIARPPCMPSWRTPAMRPTSKSPKRKPRAKRTRTRTVKIMSEMPILSNVFTKTDQAVNESGLFPYAGQLLTCHSNGYANGCTCGKAPAPKASQHEWNAKGEREYNPQDS